MCAETGKTPNSHRLLGSDGGQTAAFTRRSRYLEVTERLSPHESSVHHGVDLRPKQLFVLLLWENSSSQCLHNLELQNVELNIILLLMQKKIQAYKI